MDRANLKLRDRTYFARVRLNAEQRRLLKKSEVLRTLKTQDLREANLRKLSVLADIHAEVARSVLRAQGGPDGAEALLREGEALAAAKAQGSVSDDAAEAALDADTENFLDAAARKYGTEPATGDPLLPASEVRKIRAAYDALAGRTADALLESDTKTYLEEIGRSLVPSSVRAVSHALKLFQVWANEHPEWDGRTRTVTKQLAGQYAAHLQRKGRAARTVRSWLGSLSTFWSWAEGRGSADLNVWRGSGSTIRVSTRGKAPSRRAWTDAEIITLLRGLPTTDPLFSLAAIALFTGMRSEEIATIQLSDYADGAIIVREGKTRAALRRIPVHTALAPLMDRLAATAPDQFLIPHLLRSGYDSKRGKLEGKRFATASDRLGLTDPALTFHTLRNTLATRCEDAGVVESTTKLIMGHKRQSETYGTYSHGPRFQRLVEAIALVTYGAADEYLKTTAGAVKVTRKPRSRPKRPRQ